MPVPPNSQTAFWVLQMLVCQPSNTNSEKLLPNSSAMHATLSGSYPPHSAFEFQTPSPNLREKVLNQIPTSLHSQPFHLPALCC